MLAEGGTLDQDLESDQVGELLHRMLPTMQAYQVAPVAVLDTDPLGACLGLHQRHERQGIEVSVGAVRSAATR